METKKKGFAIGRLVWIPQSRYEFYYLRMIIILVKGPQTYGNIKCIDGFQHETFRDTCFAMRFLKMIGYTLPL